jgi:alpha-amylase
MGQCRAILLAAYHLVRLDHHVISLLICLSLLFPHVAAHAAADPEVWKRQVIYLIMPDRFHNGDRANDRLGAPDCHDPARTDKFHGGDLAGLTQKLDYLRTLGITALWITPVYRQVRGTIARGYGGYGDCGYHGYWADFPEFPAVVLEPKLGTASDLSKLIAAVHVRKMKFILDMVVNHAGYGAGLVRRRADWFHSPETCENSGDRDIFCPLAGLPDFKQELNGGAVADYLVAESAGWVRRFEIDGIRMDTASHVPPWFFRDRWVPKMNRIRPGLFLLAEGSPNRSLPQLKTFLDEQGFDSVFNFPLRRALVETFAKGNSINLVADAVGRTIATMSADQTTMLVNLLDNHDVPRFVGEAAREASEDEARRRYHLALAALFTLPGIPQLYYGNEIGLYGGADPDNRRDMPDWAWTTKGRSQSGHEGALSPSEPTFQRVRRLIEIRKSNSALFRGSYTEVWRPTSDDASEVYAFFRGDGSNRIFAVLNNSASPSQLASLPVKPNGAMMGRDRRALGDGVVLEDLLDDGALPVVTMSDGHLPVLLPAKGAAIYRPRSSRGASAVTFRVVATTNFDEALYILGDVQEFGSWDPRRAVRMTPSRCRGHTCTWSVTLRYLPHGKSLKFKFLKRSLAQTIWESGVDRSFNVPRTPTSVFDAERWRDG